MAIQNHPDKLNEKDRPRAFQEKTIPADARLVGWSRLAQSFAVRAPICRPGVVSNQHVKASVRATGEWTIYDKRYWPGKTFADYLGLALRHEDLDLLVLKRVFEAVPSGTIAALVRSAPTGASNRRAWFLYEFLTGRKLNIEVAAGAGYTDLLDHRHYFTAAPAPSRRHKIRDNLLETEISAPSSAKRKR